MNGTIAISSSRSRSSGDGGAMPTASRRLVSSSSGIRARSLTCWNDSAEVSEPLEAGCVEEVERHRTMLDGTDHVLERDPGILERLRHLHAPHIARRETVPALGA
jgi:hypothetical protein